MNSTLFFTKIFLITKQFMYMGLTTNVQNSGYKSTGPYNDLITSRYIANISVQWNLSFTVTFKFPVEGSKTQYESDKHIDFKAPNVAVFDRCS